MWDELNFFVFIETTGHNAPLRMSVNRRTGKLGSVVRFLLEFILDFKLFL
jgi:hypothetical protein